MTIYLSNYASVKRFPKNLVPVAIDADPPPYWGRGTYPQLYPTEDIMNEYVATGDGKRFVVRYLKEVLGRLSAATTVIHLSKFLYRQQDLFVVLCSKEWNTELSHRDIIAVWLTSYGYDVRPLPDNMLLPPPDSIGRVRARGD